MTGNLANDLNGTKNPANLLLCQSEMFSASLKKEPIVFQQAAYQRRLLVVKLPFTKTK